jgi:hypothetical protein
LSSGELQVLERWHGEYQDQDIREDVDCRVGEPKGFLVKTIPRLLLMPKLGHRYASDPGTDECPRSVRGQKPN